MSLYHHLSTPRPLTHGLGAGALVLSLLVISGCAQLNIPSKESASKPRPAAPVVTTPAPAPAPTPAPAVPTPSEAELADAALVQGLKAYREGKYTLAEAQLRIAVRGGLRQSADLANAHKHLAFIYCTSQRQALCAESFRSARRADPKFRLSKAEAGHPMWGPTYRRALGLK